ncbi:MAG TPA: hypothetical protein VGN20_04785 [Mucilaginibacter sp.]|jgi:hypothetical protein
MNEAAIKTELHDKIDHADPNQLKEIYGLLINYFNGQEKTEEGWDSLPEYQKEQILKGLEEADAGLGTPYDEVTRKLREKHGLNG